MSKTLRVDEDYTIEVKEEKEENENSNRDFSFTNNFESHHRITEYDESSTESFMEPLVLESDEDPNEVPAESKNILKSEPEPELKNVATNNSKNLECTSHLVLDEKAPAKRNRRTCCSYCGQIFSNIIPHLRAKHAFETDVADYLKSPKGLKERKHLMNLIRQKGKPNPQTALPVPSRHTKTQSPTISPQFKNVLFKIRLYKVFDVVRSDRMIIAFGNKHSTQTCIQLLLKQLHYLGLFLLEMKDRRVGVTELLDVFSSRHLKQCVWAFKAIARFDPTSEKYKRHNVAFILGGALTEVATLAQGFYSEEDSRSKDVAKFAEKFSLEVKQINASLERSKVQKAISKLCNAPIISDIVALNRFLNDERRQCCRDLSNGFEVSRWKKLVRFTLVSLKVFNPRREEIESVKIVEYYETLRQFEEQNLPPESQEIAKLCYKFKVRSKVVLLHQELVVCIEYILKYRRRAGVSPTNPYVFGFPSAANDNYLYVDRYLSDFAVQCGARKPKSLKQSSLRECLAFSISYNLQDLVQFVERGARVEYLDHSYCRVRIPWDDNSKVEGLVSLLVNVQESQNWEDESDEETDSVGEEEEFDAISIKEEAVEEGEMIEETETEPEEVEKLRPSIRKPKWRQEDKLREEEKFDVISIKEEAVEEISAIIKEEMDIEHSICDQSEVEEPEEVKKFKPSIREPKWGQDRTFEGKLREEEKLDAISIKEEAVEEISVIIKEEIDVETSTCDQAEIEEPEEIKKASVEVKPSKKPKRRPKRKLDKHKEEKFGTVSIKEGEITSEVVEEPTEILICVLENDLSEIEPKEIKKPEVAVESKPSKIPKRGQKRKLEDTLQSSREETTEDAELKKILGTIGTKGWTVEERMLIVNEFRPYLYINEYPRGWEISELIAKHKLEKSVTKVRSQIQNLKRHVQNGLKL